MFSSVLIKPPNVLSANHVIEASLKHRNDKLNAFIDKVTEDISAQKNYLTIQDKYQKLLSTQ